MNTIFGIFFSRIIQRLFYCIIMDASRFKIPIYYFPIYQNILEIKFIQSFIFIIIYAKKLQEDLNKLNLYIIQTVYSIYKITFHLCMID